METEKKRETVDRGWYEYLQLLVTVIVALVLLFSFVIRFVNVDGVSMQNTLQHGDRMLVLNGWLCGDYERGDIVIAAKNGFENGSPVVKRVIAVGGQTVDIDFPAGIVYVDGVPLEEPYIKEATHLREGVEFPLILQEDELFLLGDNRNESKDSRHPDLGAVKEGNIIGRAVFLVLPGKTEGLGKREWSRISALN
ncbi:MAG: signal peptidase I [Ruminococcaceae bacterium]|nr:signal peptidase I [Oscillospiraceae bacterium]